MAFALLNKFQDGVVELPAVIVDYLGVKFGPVDTVLCAPNDASASYNPTYWVTGVATHVLGSSNFKQATDRQGNIFIACRNKEDEKKMDRNMAFRLIKEIVRMNMEPTNICTILNEDQLSALVSLKGPQRHVLCVWIEKEARHGSSWLCQYIPPLSILKFTDLLNKLWGWDRLLAYDLEGEFDDPYYMPMYESYLDKFYASNHHHIKSAADAILQCIEKEKALSAKWKAKRIKVFPSVVDVSDDVEEYMSNLVNDAENSRRPLIAYAAACITKEAELMIEWLSQDSAVPLEEYSICTDIRQWAFDLAMLQGIWSTHTAAVLLGMAKEAGSLVENVRLGCLESTDISLRIRTYGSNFLFHKLDEFESDAELTPGVSDEMTSATERNQLTSGNTEGVSFRKKPKKNLANTIDSEDEYPVIIFRRPTAVDEYKQSRSNAESMRP